MRKKCKTISLSITLILILMLTITPAVYAMSYALPQDYHMIDNDDIDMRSAAPNNHPLASLEELLEWYNAPWVRGDSPVLANDIIVDREVTLSETAKPKDLGAIEHVIRVTAGGSLTLNNSKLNIIAMNTDMPAIIVEPGGVLTLLNGAIWPTLKATTIVVEKSGRLVKGEFSEFYIYNGGKILDKNELPTDPEEKPDPPLPAIQNTMGFDYSLSCMVGEPPASSDYPPTEWVTYEDADKIPMQKELPVWWELDTVDFETAGTYAVKGIFTDDILTANNLSNPNDVYSTLQLTVIKQGAIDMMTGNILSVGSGGNCHIRLAMPPLPEGATALYIYKSADGKRWQKAVQEVYTNGNILSYYDNFLPHAMITPTKLYVQYYYQTDYSPIWLRVEVVGSASSGISNKIKLTMPESAKPGDNVNTGETGDDDGSGGNRGGGGQSEGKREFLEVEKKPSEIETPPMDETLTADDEISSDTAIEQAKGDIKTSYGTSSRGGSSVSEPPVVIYFDAGKEESVTISSYSLPKQETENTDLEVQALSVETENSPPYQRSRGVLLTAEATAFVGCGLLLLRKLYKKPKRKP